MRNAPFVAAGVVLSVALTAVVRTVLALTVLALTVLVLPGSPALGQGARGLRWPGTSLVVSDDSVALSMNPAGLGFLQGLDLRYVHSELDALSGDGDGVFVATHVLGPLSLGMGFEFLPRPALSERALRYTFGAALGFDRTASIGFNLHHFTSDASPELDGLLSLDLGLMVRPLSWLAIGLQVEDLNTPVLAQKRLERVYGLGLGFRPGTDRVLLTAEGRIEENSWDADVGFRLDAEVLPGATIGGEVVLGPRDEGLELFVGTHVTLSFGWVGATGGAFFGGSDAVDFEGYTAGVRLSTRAERPLFQRHGRAVVLTLGGNLPEQPSGGLFTTRRATFGEIVVALDRLRHDDRVDAVLLKLRGYDGGWAQTQELRAVLADLRAAGKTVVVHAVTPDTRAYYLGAESDRFVLHPSGGVFLTGLAITSTYLAEALEALGVQAQFVAIGDWKSFPEMFTRRGPTDPARGQRDRLLDGLWNQLLEGAAAGRRLSPDQLKALVDEGPYASKEALEKGLVDALAYDDELKAEMETAVGHAVSLREDWLAEIERSRRWGPREHVAVIPIQGSIVDGESAVIPFFGMRFVGANTIERALDAAVANRNARAILVRVDSPGGSSVASARMHRAIQRAAERKPLVVSFGDAAASGGYYAAAGAPQILAEPGTMTGSIGVFAGKFVVRDLLEKLGVHQEVTRRGDHAAFFSSALPWTDEETALVGARIRALYDEFVEKVAAGRKLTVEEVHAVAQGQVWLGSEAQAHKLVDQMGGLREALWALHERLGRERDDYLPLRYYPEPGLLSRLGFGATAEAPGAAPAPAEDAEGFGADSPALPPPLAAAAKVLAPLLAPYAANEPLALLPVHYEVR